MKAARWPEYSYRFLLGMDSMLSPGMNAIDTVLALWILVWKSFQIVRCAIKEDKRAHLIWDGGYCLTRNVRFEDKC